MKFEYVIENAPTLFLFDRRSHQKLAEIVAATKPGSRDYFLTRITQAAFGFYNAIDDGVDLRGPIRQAMEILKEAEQYRGEPAIDLLVRKMEVDILLQTSFLRFKLAPKQMALEQLLNKEDLRALELIRAALAAMPVSFDPLPSNWYSSLIPLLPPFKEQVLLFYKDRVTDNRIKPLAAIVRQIHTELQTAEGLIMAKQFIRERGVETGPLDELLRLVGHPLKRMTQVLREGVGEDFVLMSDIRVPTGIGTRHLNDGLSALEPKLAAAQKKRDAIALTSHLIHQGILNFLREEWEETVKALVKALKVSRSIPAADRVLRANRHEEFPDLPFMVGTACLRLALPLAGEKPFEELLAKSRQGLMQALALNGEYHQAYVNLAVAQGLDPLSGEGETERLVGLYLKVFQNSLALIHRNFFLNLAYVDSRKSGQPHTSQMVKWLVLSHLSHGGELTVGQRMLVELKTLYVLNAHDVAAAYHNTYRAMLRDENPEFLNDIQNGQLHSALLFFMAHAYTYLSLKPNKATGELDLDFDLLRKAMEINTESLYFNPKNSSAVRLAGTQGQLIGYRLGELEKRWIQINKNMARRFDLYETYLGVLFTQRYFLGRLRDLKMDGLHKEVKISPQAEAKMESSLTDEQRERAYERMRRLR